MSCHRVIASLAAVLLASSALAQSGSDKIAPASSKKFDGRRMAAASLRGRDLSGATFAGTDLRAADLRGANLSGADLSAADLRGALFDAKTILRGADLRRANLESTNLGGAALTGADLRQARLHGARGIADVKGADLRGAHLEGADMSGAIGLAQALTRDACYDRSTRLPRGFDPRGQLEAADAAGDGKVPNAGSTMPQGIR